MRVRLSRKHGLCRWSIPNVLITGSTWHVWEIFRWSEMRWASRMWVLCRTSIWWVIKCSLCCVRSWPRNSMLTKVVVSDGTSSCERIWHKLMISMLCNQSRLTMICPWDKSQIYRLAFSQLEKEELDHGHRWSGSHPVIHLALTHRVRTPLEIYIHKICHSTLTLTCWIYAIRQKWLNSLSCLSLRLRLNEMHHKHKRRWINWKHSSERSRLWILKIMEVWIKLWPIYLSLKISSKLRMTLFTNSNRTASNTMPRRTK